MQVPITYDVWKSIVTGDETYPGVTVVVSGSAQDMSMYPDGMSLQVVADGVGGIIKTDKDGILALAAANSDFAPILDPIFQGSGITLPVNSISDRPSNRVHGRIRFEKDL